MTPTSMISGSTVREAIARLQAAARRRRPEHIELMRDALSRYACAETPRAEQLADSAFHEAVCQATGNPQIVGLSRDLLTKVSLGFPVEPWGRGEPSAFRRALREHTELCEAIASGEPDRAAELAREHFAISAGMIRDVLPRGLAGPLESAPPDQPRPSGSCSSR